MQSIWSWHNISSGLLNFNLVQVNSELCAQVQVTAESQAQKNSVLRSNYVFITENNYNNKRILIHI